MKYSISYEVEVPTPDNLKVLLSEIESETGMIPISIKDENDEEVTL